MTKVQLNDNEALQVAKELWAEGYSRNAISEKISRGHGVVQGWINEFAKDPKLKVQHDKNAKKRMKEGAERGGKASHRVKAYYVYLGYHPADRVGNNNKPREFDVMMVPPRGKYSDQQIQEMAYDRLIYALAVKDGYAWNEVMARFDEYADAFQFLRTWKIGIEELPRELGLPSGLWMVNDYTRYYSPSFWMGINGDLVQVGRLTKPVDQMPQWYTKLIEFRAKRVTLDLDDMEKEEALTYKNRLVAMLRSYGLKPQVQFKESTHLTGWHVIAELDEPLDWSVHFELREICHDDKERIRHDQMRVEFYPGQGEVIFDKKIKV